MSSQATLYPRKAESRFALLRRPKLRVLQGPACGPRAAQERVPSDAFCKAFVLQQEEVEWQYLSLQADVNSK
jgi:hypothetical protein